MKTIELNNAVQVEGIDLHDDESCRALGKLIAEKCVVFVRDSVSEARLHEIHTLWGQPYLGPMYNYIVQRKLTGPHWRRYLVSTNNISKGLGTKEKRPGMVRVSFEKNARGKPQGLFTNGSLDWHSDNQASFDRQKVVGLMSLWGSKNSQTSFLSTAKAYAAMSAQDRSMAEELYSVWAWDGLMSPDLIPSQQEIVKYNIAPLAGMECPLVDETNAGVKGIRFPSHSFSHFRGMGRTESLKVRDHLWAQINRPEYIYTHDWQDNEIVFMDQNITLHARPTNVQEGDRRTMCRMCSYLDRIYPDRGPADFVWFKGERISHDEFITLIDAQQAKDYTLEKSGQVHVH